MSKIQGVRENFEYKTQKGYLCPFWYLLYGGLFYFRLGLFYLWLVFATYGGLFLLTVEIRFGLFYLRLKFGLVFFAHGGKSARSFLLTVPLSGKLGLVFFAYGSPTVSKKDEP